VEKVTAPPQTEEELLLFFLELGIKEHRSSD